MSWLLENEQFEIVSFPNKKFFVAVSLIQYITFEDISVKVSYLFTDLDNLKRYKFK